MMHARCIFLQRDEIPIGLLKCGLDARHGVVGVPRVAVLTEAHSR